jgi:hypothetical protein
MSSPGSPALRERTAIWISFLVLLAIAFFQCLRTTHDLIWPFDVDFDRDMSFVQGTLDGQYGMDPSYLHEHLWYSPLLFLLETWIVKLTGAPVSVVLVRAGAWLNILGPICFFWMCRRLFDWRIALAASLSYLFLASGKILLVIGATYTPWLYPSSFMLFAFYIDILLCYWAFSTGKYAAFALLGLATGITFLGHAAPAVIIVLIMVALQVGNMLKNKTQFKTYLIQGIIAFIFFCIAAAPIFYYILGKYHLHIINREPSEYTEGLFYINNLWGLVKANLTVGFIVAIIGLVYFYRTFPKNLVRRIIAYWLIISVGLYLYASIVSGLDHKYGIKLPAMVPSFHYFMYIKAIQSVFFGFGLVFLLSPLHKYWAVLIPILALAVFPWYIKREDFTIGREKSLAKQNNTDAVAVYDFILHNLTPDKVVLCEKDPSLFPVMPAGRKMVSNAYTFSNPYVDFEKREADREAMLTAIQTGQQQQLQKLLSEYGVDYILLSSKALAAMQAGAAVPGHVVLRNGSYTLYALQ